MTKQPRKPEPGEVVKFGFPSWLGERGLIVFGAKRPERSLLQVQQSVTTAEQGQLKNSTLESRRTTPPDDPEAGM